MTLETIVSLLGVGLLATGAYLGAGVIYQKYVNRAVAGERQPLRYRGRAKGSSQPQHLDARVLGSSSSLPVVLQRDFTEEQWEALESLKASYRRQDSRTWAQDFVRGCKERRGEL